MIWAGTAFLALLVGCCVILQGFFSGSEMALVSANRAVLQARADKGETGAALALRLLHREDRLLGTCLIGTNLCVITGATIFGVMLRWHDMDQGLVVLALFTPVALIFGETFPKTLMQHHSTTLAPWLAFPLRFAQIAFFPILLIVGGWSRVLAQLTGSSEKQGITREEILDLLDDTPVKTSDIDADEREMIQRIFAISETPVEACMTPLVDVDLIPHDASVGDAVAVAVRHGFSRIPVYQDRVDNVIGILSALDLLFCESEAPITDLVKPIRFVPESKPPNDLLRELRRESEHFVVVVDEYGGSVGVVTVEDLLEEVVGEIRDEHDEDDPRVVRLGPNEWRVPARMEVDELRDSIAHTLPEGDYETLAGLILSVVGRIPDVGETIPHEGFTFHIEEATDRAILTVRLTAPWQS